MNWRSADSVCPPSGIAPLAQHSRCRCPLIRPGMTMLPGSSISVAGRYFASIAARLPTSVMAPPDTAIAPSR